MKKLLSILGVCGLVGMSANLTACNKPNNNENGENNKPEPKPKPEPELPPKNSNWKLMPRATNKLSHPNYLNIADNKNYIFIYNNDIPRNYKIVKIINDGFNYPSNISKFIRDYITKYSTYWNAIVKASYRWDGIGEPITLPQIDKNTGEITDWKG
jgi:hypothetical protein